MEVWDQYNKKILGSKELLKNLPNFAENMGLKNGKKSKCRKRREILSKIMIYTHKYLWKKCIGGLKHEEIQSEHNFSIKKKFKWILGVHQKKILHFNFKKSKWTLGVHKKKSTEKSLLKKSKWAKRALLYYNASTQLAMWQSRQTE